MWLTNLHIFPEALNLHRTIHITLKIQLPIAVGKVECSTRPFIYLVGGGVASVVVSWSATSKLSSLFVWGVRASLVLPDAVLLKLSVWTMPSDAVTVAVTAGLGMSVVVGVVSGLCYILVQGYSRKRWERSVKLKYGLVLFSSYTNILVVVVYL